MSLSRLGLDELARKWMVPDVPTDLEQSRELRRAATRRFKLLRRTRGFSVEMSWQFSHQCVLRARDRAVAGLITAGLTEEAELLANDPLQTLGENRIGLWFRIQAPGAEAGGRAKLASVEARSAHQRADEAIPVMLHSERTADVAREQLMSALHRGFEAADAQDRAYAAGGAALATRAMLAAAGSLVDSGHAKAAANIAVFSANAAIQAAAARDYALTQQDRHDDLQRLFHEASVGELRLQSKWLTQHLQP